MLWRLRVDDLLRLKPKMMQLDSRSLSLKLFPAPSGHELLIFFLLLRPKSNLRVPELKMLIEANYGNLTKCAWENAASRQNICSREDKHNLEATKLFWLFAVSVSGKSFNGYSWHKLGICLSEVLQCGVRAKSRRSWIQFELISRRFSDRKIIERAMREQRLKLSIRLKLLHKLLLRFP